MSVIGVDIGGTKTLAALVHADGSVGELVRLPTPASDGPAAILATALNAAKAVLPAAGDSLTACGVGTAGAVDPAGRIHHATDSLRGWQGTDVRSAFVAGMGVPVTVVNDVHAMALGEAHRGAARDVSDVLVVAVGTGVGGAVVHNHRLVPGRHGLAGSIGHLPAVVRTGRRCGCGGVDHVEAYTAGPAIAADYAARARLPGPVPLEQVAAAANDGDALACSVIRDAARVLGAGLAAAANLLDPELIVLGGGVLNLGDVLLDEVRSAVRAFALPGPHRVPLRIASGGSATVLTGAAWVAQQALQTEPPPP
jgi:glucokinase